MPEAEIGWIAAIIIGGLAGWFAEMFMKSGTGIFMNIVLGIVGAALANWLLSLFGVGLGGLLGYLITGFIGACTVNQWGDRFVESKLKSDTVLHVIVWKDQPESRIRSARLDQVFLDLDGDEIAEPDRRKGQDRNSNCDLGGKCRLDGSVGKICAGFTH